jgi:HicB family
MLGDIQMSTMTIRLPDDKHERLKRLARSRRVSVNKLVEELATSVLSAHDAEVRFRALALRGNPKKALGLLDRLDSGRKK